MKYCDCEKCKNQINLKRNIGYTITPRGYKFFDESYFAVCPHCGHKQGVDPRKVPFRIRWKMFWEICFKRPIWAPQKNSWL